MKTGWFRMKLPLLIVLVFLLAVTTVSVIYAVREGEIERLIHSWLAGERVGTTEAAQDEFCPGPSLVLLELEGEEGCYLTALCQGKLYVLEIPGELVVRDGEEKFSISHLHKSGLGEIWSFLGQVCQLPVHHCLVMRVEDLVALVERAGGISLPWVSQQDDLDDWDRLTQRLDELRSEGNASLRAGLILLSYATLWKKIFKSINLFVHYQLERQLASAVQVDGNVSYRDLRAWGRQMEGLAEEDIVTLPCPKTFSGEMDELDLSALRGIISVLLEGGDLEGAVGTIQRKNEEAEEARREWEWRKRLTFDPVPVEVIFRAGTGRKEVAITLDDGYNLDPRILDLLERHHIRCTVFLVGGWVRANPDWVRRMDSDGFEVCNHTLRHLWLTKLPDDQIRYELVEAEHIIFGITGKNVHYFRPPGGFYDARVAIIVASLGYRMVMWSIDSADTRYRSTPPETRAANILARVKPGDILLFHFGGYYTYETLSLVIPQLEAQGYKMVTLTELLKP